MNDYKLLWDAMLIASIVFVAGFSAQTQQATSAADSVEPEGRIVEIAPAVGEQETIIEEAEQPAQPSYWIGIRGRNVTEPVLRTQFQLAHDMGVVIEEVVKDSPAAKAGLRQHDILLRANGEPVLSMSELSQLVAEGDAKPIELRLIRLGKDETIVVVPEERPVGMENSGDRGFSFGPDGADVLGGLGLFPGGIAVQPQAGVMAFNKSLPNGYVVTVTRQNNEPAKITVSKGDKTWTIIGNDEEAIAQLPEEVHEQVRKMLDGNVQIEMGNDFNQMKKQMLEFQQRWPGGNFNMPRGFPVQQSARPSSRTYGGIWNDS